MRIKHFSNDADAMVKASLRSLSLINPAVFFDEASKTIFNRSYKDNTQVRIVSGGGAGHEPSFSGFCGDGGLTAAVSGNVFASPTSRQVLQAIERVQSPAGVLVTVMNYTGDVLNFGVAVEKARARNPHLLAKMLVVGDDCSVPKNQGGKVGNRGIAGTILVHKVTGAAAAAGCSLDEVYDLGQLTARNLASIGVSLDRVHVPGQTVSETESLQPDQVELGMGIHNERGVSRLHGDDATLSKVVAVMIAKLLATVSVKNDDKVVAMVNNLGGLSVLEFGAVIDATNEQLRTQHNVPITRLFAGTFMTSLDGPGFSVSILNVSSTGQAEPILQYLDTPMDVPGWTAPRDNRVWEVHDALSEDASLKDSDETQSGPKLNRETNVAPGVELITRRLQIALDAVFAVEPEVTRYDQIVGDGDCGTTLRRGAEGVRHLLSRRAHNVVDLLEGVSSTIEDTMDGTSGAIYAIFFHALTTYVKKEAAKFEDALTVAAWTDAVDAAVQSLRQYTPATVGDRTLMDALIPFVQTLRETRNVTTAAEAATDGAEKTKYLKASLGRTVYVGGEDEWFGTVPDPGAYGLAALLRGLALGISKF